MAEIPAGYQRLEGSERRVRRGARLLGPAGGDEKLSVSIRVRRKPGAPPLPDQEYWVKTPPGKRKFISRAEFAESYGAARVDLDRVAEFARSHGLSITEKSVSRRLVIVSGTVAQASRAFAVELGRYESPTETYRGREGYIHLPGEIADIVEGVFGLDNRIMARRAGNGGPPGANALTPPLVAQLYNFPQTVSGAGMVPGTAPGQTIGILEFGGGYDPADINTFCAGLKLPNGQPLPAPNVWPVSVDSATTGLTGGANAPNKSDIEVALDLEIVASVALGANIAVFFAPNTEQGWIDAVTLALNVTDVENWPGWAAPSVLSCSWGWSENDDEGFEWTKMAVDALSSGSTPGSPSGCFSDAANLHVTVFVASGDYGSAGGPEDTSAHVQYPSSDPWVTACGGTVIQSIPPLTESNWTQPIWNEGTWNDEAYSYGGATGGGISVLFPVPFWQQGIGLPNPVTPGQTPGRGVPDIAGNASGYSGYVLSIYDMQTTQVFGPGPSGPEPFGPNGAIAGTSAVAPLYAALMALINAGLGYNVGYLNPTLYQIGRMPVQTTIRNISDGVSNGFNGVPGYASMIPTVPGGPAIWNACTGWGVLNGTNLLVALLELNTGCIPKLVNGLVSLFQSGRLWFQGSPH
jgi:kumamolisin